MRRTAPLVSGATVPVWGQADPGEAVTVEVAGQKKTAGAGSEECDSSADASLMTPAMTRARPTTW